MRLQAHRLGAVKVAPFFSLPAHPFCVAEMAIAMAACAPLAAHANPTVDISLAHGTPAEARTGAQLQTLLQEYDLAPWICTRAVRIEAFAVPHSHPVLTLHTRHSDHPELLLSTFLHEQMHWFLAAHERDANAAMAELRKMYPVIPVGYPQGSNDSDGNYEHLLVDHLEFEADRSLLGPDVATAVMHTWTQDHYTWLYTALLQDDTRVAAVVRKHHLSPLSSTQPGQPPTPCLPPIPHVAVH